MFDFTLVLLSVIFIIPFLMVGLTLISQQERHPWIALACLGLVLLGLLALALGGETEVDPGWRFLGEPITFSITYTAIWLNVFVLLGLGSLLWPMLRHGDARMTPYQWSMLHLSLAFGFLAFISGQFMIRYIALDIVGLLAALTVLSTFKADTGLKHFITIFQILRLGDLSLLASILLINHLTGTLDITRMLTAAVDLPPNMRTWIYFGFLLALLIKLAIWPFGVWLERAHQSAPRLSFWISGLLLPVLGFYLLYRVAPIFQSGMIFQYLTLATALVLALLMILLTGLHVIRFDRFTKVSGVMSCFLLAGVAIEGGQYLVYYLLGLVVHRWLLLFDVENDSLQIPMVSALFPLLVNGLFIAVNFDVFPLAFIIGWIGLTVTMVVWDLAVQRRPVPVAAPVVINAEKLLNDEAYGKIFVKAARWLSSVFELGVLTHGIARMSAFFHQIAEWLYHNIEMGMESIWIWIGRKLVQLSEGTLRKVEVGSAKKTGSIMEEALNSLQTYEQKVLRKPLRWDLAWIPFFLVVILIILFVL